MSYIERIFRAFLAALFVTAATLQFAHAGESPFGYLYTADTHPKGSFEFEQWMTMRKGKMQGDYSLGQYRTEIEYGVTDRFQASLYWNTYSINALGSNSAGETAGPYIPENIDKAQRYRRGLRTDGWSAEFIYRVLSPYTDPGGLALYVEPSFGKFKNELETKLILQKNFLDDRLVLAYNLTVAPEWEKKSGDPTADPASADFNARTEKVAELIHTFGVSYRFAPGWSAALEARNHNEYAGHSLKRSNREFSAWNLGPTLHYASKSWWVTASWLPQLRTGRCYTDNQCAETANRRNLGDLDRQEFRFRFGIPF
jgi:hypothetical protein